MPAQSSKTTTTAEKAPAHQRRLPTTTQTTSGLLPPGMLQSAVEDPAAAPPAGILALQHRYGNQAVQRLLARHLVQTKINVGPAGDTYEQEADHAADQVMAMPAPQAAARRPEARRKEDEEDAPAVQAQPLVGNITPLLQRKEAEDDLGVQPKREDLRAGFEAGAAVEAQLHGQQGSGSPLPAEVRSYMEPRFGADFAGVRLHTGTEASQISRQLGAQAFTHGQDIYLGDGKYNPGSGEGQRLLAHELTHVVQQTGSAVRRETLQRKYADVPSLAQWKQDSAVKRTKRSSKLQEIDDALETWDGLKQGSDKNAQIEQLRQLRIVIDQWQTQKRQKYATAGTVKGKIKQTVSQTGSLFHPSLEGRSIRGDIVADLLEAVDQKLKTVQAAYRIDLAPLAQEYQQAAQAHNLDLTHVKGEQLSTLDLEFFYTTTQAAMARAKATDMLEWACYYFGSPDKAYGGFSLTPLSLKAVADFGWLSPGLADQIIDNFLIPVMQRSATFVMQMFQHQPFRQALETKATPAKYQPLVKDMPLLRITGQVEQKIKSNVVDINNIDQLAEVVFQHFLADLPISNLFYSTVSSTFSVVDYLLGKRDATKVGAPCMVLSSIFNELFKMITPTHPPLITQGDDPKPLLTKPLAGIGTRGILTQEKTFKGNVKRYGALQGYDAINRIFFGDGHFWLVINGKEYDPTLGISGPPGTVAAQVERHFVAGDKGEFKSGDLVAKRTSECPPGGAKLLFDRTVEIAATGVAQAEEKNWKYLEPVPGTDYVVVRQEWLPLGERRLLHNIDSKLLAVSMTASEAATLVSTFRALQQTSVGDLNSLLESVNKASLMAIPVKVTLARLALVQHNVQEIVIHRLRADHRMLKQNGLLSRTVDDDFDKAFRHVKIPGSDPHKGGQVVVFAIYENAARQEETVVYKPGNLWIDKLLFGSGPESIAPQLGADMARYTIVQRQRPLAEHHLKEYGYMEFAKGGTPASRADIMSVYTSLGAVLAMAYKFGLRDIHQENFILQRDRVLLIDMEAATGTYTGFEKMEFLLFPAALATKIGKGLGQIAPAEIEGVIPAARDIKDAVRIGFEAKLIALRGPNFSKTAETVAEGTTRIVPFKTEDLQRLAGASFGKIGPDASKSQQAAYAQQVEKLVNQTATVVLKMPDDEALKDELRALLNSAETKAAFNRGDVPYWMRTGDSILDEAGNRVVEHSRLGRISDKEAIKQGILTRGKPEDMRRARADLSKQVLPLLNGTPATIQQQYQIAYADSHRALQGALPPGPAPATAPEESLAGIFET